jgi:hypothetical protein
MTHTTFPNLARHLTVWNGKLDILIDNAQDVANEVTSIVTAELTSAGIKPFDLSFGKLENVRREGGRFPEVPTGIMGFLNYWKFKRAWYYYVAEGAGIPPEFAVPFDKQWGKEVRADGDCGCRGVEFWGEGFAISLYHINTLEGLQAFADMLKTILKPHPERNPIEQRGKGEYALP